MESREQERARVSRRDFVKGVALAGAAAAGASTLTGCATKASSEAPYMWDDSADVLILGGGTGLMAAIQAATSGAGKVLVLDKQASAGGDTAICSGGFYAADTSVMKAAGVVDARTGKQDTQEQAVADWLKTGGGVEDPDLIKAIVAEGPILIDWFVARGVEFFVVQGGPDPVARSHVNAPTIAEAGGKNFVNPMLDEIKKHSNISILTNTTVLEVLQDPKTNRIVGVRAVSGETVKYYGGKVVIMALGGVGANLALTMEYNPESIDWINIGGGQATGDWVPMAKTLRANLVGFRNKFKPIPTFSNPAVYGSPENGIPMVTSLLAQLAETGPRAVMNVNADGKRFSNEADPADGGVGIAIAQQPGGAWCVHDQTFYDDPANVFYLPPLGSKDQLAKCVDAGIILKADSLAELATEMGVSATALEQTVATYNGYAAAGSDPEFNRSAKSMAPIKTGPFYAFKMVAANVTPWLGANISLDVNASCQVLGLDGNIIPRLYAVGVGVASWRTMGYTYPGGGACIASGLGMGNIAGRAAAAEAKTIS